MTRMAEPTRSFAICNHTTYSLLDGASAPRSCARAPRRTARPAVAITDHGNLFGALDFGKQAAHPRDQADHRHRRPTSRRGRASSASPTPCREWVRKNYYHLVLLPRTTPGYKNLIRLSSAGYLEGFYYRPRIDRELLREHSAG